MIRLSAVIITFNEEKNIGRCLDSLRSVADEIVVVDSGSADNTTAIAVAKGARVIENKFEGFTQQKNFAVQQASFDYILSLDADEYLSPELERSVLEVKSAWAADGFTMNRLNSYAEKWIKTCGWYPDCKIRLWDRRKGRWRGGLLHEIVVLDEGSVTGHLKGDLLHLAYQNAAQLVNKMQYYSDIYAQQNAFEKKVTPFTIWYKTVAAFFKNFIVKRGILDGYEGLVISVSNANGVFYKYSKLYENNRKLKTSLIITTYNRKDALELVLQSVLQQEELPDEVIIADDGSREDTAKMIRDYAATFPIPLRHVWQEDEGFRAAAIRNKALAVANNDYIVFIDGDLVLHPNFIADHKRIAHKRYFIQGSRVLLNEKLTASAIRDRRTIFSIFESGVYNRKNMVRSRWLSRLFSYKSKNLYRVRSVNLSFWLEDAKKVNGFNEDFVGWGREDSEFAARMQNAGLIKLHLKFAGFGYHLFHPENSRAMLPQNQEILDNAVKNKTIYCGNGLNKYMNTKTQNSRDQLPEKKIS